MEPTLSLGHFTLQSGFWLSLKKQKRKPPLPRPPPQWTGATRRPLSPRSRRTNRRTPSRARRTHGKFGGGEGVCVSSCPFLISFLVKLSSTYLHRCAQCASPSHGVPGRFARRRRMKSSRHFTIGSHCTAARRLPPQQLCGHVAVTVAQSLAAGSVTVFCPPVTFLREGQSPVREAAA